MADRVLRGVGLGTKSFKDEQGIEFAEHNQVELDYPKSHHLEVTFATEAELPFEWECKWCGQTMKRSDGVTGEAKETRPPWTHWDMLRERHSIPGLEDILAEQLDKLRGPAD